MSAKGLPAGANLLTVPDAWIALYLFNYWLPVELEVQAIKLITQLRQIMAELEICARNDDGSFQAFLRRLERRPFRLAKTAHAIH